MTAPIAQSPSLEERYAEALRVKAERESKRELERKAFDLKVLDLENKYEAELGPRGRAFELITWPELDQVVALSPSEHVVVKRFDAACKKKLGASEEDQVEYVIPSVLYPTKEEFRTLHKARPAVVVMCVAALLRLQGLKMEEVAGKT